MSGAATVFVIEPPLQAQHSNENLLIEYQFSFFGGKQFSRKFASGETSTMKCAFHVHLICPAHLSLRKIRREDGRYTHVKCICNAPRSFIPSPTCAALKIHHNEDTRSSWQSPSPPPPPRPSRILACIIVAPCTRSASFLRANSGTAK